MSRFGTPIRSNENLGGSVKLKKDEVKQKLTEIVGKGNVARKIMHHVGKD